MPLAAGKAGQQWEELNIEVRVKTKDKLVNMRCYGIKEKKEKLWALMEAYRSVQGNDTFSSRLRVG